LLIKNHFSIEKILKDFDHSGILYYTNTTDDSFTKITFKEYNDIKIINEKNFVKTNCFYDYILYFVLNLIIKK